MKSNWSFLVILLAVFSMSCVSRPAVSEKKTGEDALKIIKKNSPSVKKHFEPREVIVSGSGYRSVEDIVVKGELLVDGSEFAVSYNFAAASAGDGNTFYIPFYAEDLKNGVSYNDTLSWNPSEEEAGLLLSFDDNYWNTWRQYFPLFDSYNAKVTFFVQGSLEPQDSADPDGVLSAGDDGLEDFCFEALSRGHSLGFHTINHLDLTKVSPETFYSETIEAAGAFFKKNIPLSAFAYPFGFSQPWMHEALAPVFSVTRGYGTNIRFCDTEIASNGYIVSKAIDNIIYPDKDKFENDMRLILLAAKFTGHCVVPFTTHDISDEAQWGIEQNRLEFLLKTARDLKLKFYTYSAFREIFSVK